MNFVKIDTILKDWMDFSGESDNIKEETIKKWASDAVSRITTAKQYKEGIALLDVVNYKAQLPDGFKYVCQAAYQVDDAKPCSREQVVEWVQKAYDGSGCEFKINLECPKCHEVKCGCNSPVVEVDINKIWLDAHPELAVNDMSHYSKAIKYGFNTCSKYSPDFRLMKRKSGSFWNAPYHLNNCPNINLDCSVEYNIDCPAIIVNFPKGKILLSYVKEQTDDDGYLLIPDEPIVFEAINKFIEERLAYIDYRNSKDSKGHYTFYQNAEIRKEQAIARAKSELRVPKYDEFNVFIDNYWKKVLPYYDDEKNLYRHKPDQFNYRNQDLNRGYGRK